MSTINNAQKIEQLSQQITNIFEAIKSKDIENVSNSIGQIKALENEIKGIEFLDKIESINKRNNEAKTVLIDLLKIGKVDSNVLTAKGDFNKVVIKKYPILLELKEKYTYFYLNFENHRVEVVANGICFNIAVKNYQSNEMDFFTSLEDIAKENDVLLSPLDSKEVLSKLKAINEASNKLKAQILEYNETLKSLDGSLLKECKLLNRDVITEYIYTSKY